MAYVIAKLFFLFLLSQKTSLSCNVDSFDTNIDPSYINCENPTKNASEKHCTTFAVLHANAYYSSLSNLSLYLGLNQFSIAEANGFSPTTVFLPKNQPLLIPIDCKCSETTGFFQAEVSKTTTAGENFDGISQSLEGLTTCKAIQEKNPGFFPWDVPERSKILLPLKCGCPSDAQNISGVKFLVSYPVSSDDNLTALSEQFNVTAEAIIVANNMSQNKPVFSSSAILIPLSQKPLLGSLAKPSEPTVGFPKNTNFRSFEKKKKKSKMWKLTVSLIVISVTLGLGIVVFFVFRMWKKKKKEQRNLSEKMPDLELQQLNLSIRTTSEKKVSFEGSQSTQDGQMMDLTTPRSKLVLESYTLEELNRATEDFHSQNLIEGSVYHGRLNGKNLAIRCTSSDFISKVDYTLFQDAIHNHPNIMRVLGSSCSTDKVSESYLVFEYAENGSLKDWIHGGLAMKSHFIASCCCSLTWTQRLRICLDVASAMQYMHHIMHPVYVHQNIRSRNIFLDEEFNAKVGNFGMSHCTDQNATKEEEFNLRNPSSWNKGYLAPEYLSQGTIDSPSIDIFAFGVVLLEILSGKTPVIFSEGQVMILHEEIKGILESKDVNEQLRGWIDGHLGENYSLEAAVSLANLARECTENVSSLRPSAGEIVDKLSRLVVVEEKTQLGDEHLLVISESSSKPLVQEAGSNM